MIGTRLAASAEAYAHEEYKRRIVAVQADDTAPTTIFGPEWPHQLTRVIRHRVVSEWSTREDEVVYAAAPTAFIGQTGLAGQPMPLPIFSALLPTPETTGDWEEMSLVAGESVGLAHDIQPAEQIVRGMLEEAREIIERRFMGMLPTPRR